MVKISFLLKEPKATEPTPIFAFVSFEGQRVKVYSKLAIHPKQWLKAENRAITRGYPANGLLNDALELLEDRLKTCYAEHRAQGLLPTTEALRAAAQPAAPEPEPEPKPEAASTTSLVQAYEEWMTSRRNAVSVATQKIDRTTLNHLLAFQQHERYAVDFDTITPVFGDRFTHYLLHQVQLTDNTINKAISRFKQFLSFAVERGYTSNRAFERLKWKKQDPEIITLTAEEVARLEEVTLTQPYLRNARDLFLLSCYTGLRYSDLVSIRPEHVRPGSLRLTTQKTRETVTIPLRPQAVALLERYLAGEVRPISNQKLNDYLKELGQLAGLDTPVEQHRYRGGQRITRRQPKWQCIGCHTGRRTFVTLALERGIRPEVVMKVTGHRSWQAFKRYVDITEQTVEREFQRAFAS